jgi:hypothetical protein
VKSLEILPIRNTLSVETFSVPPAVVFRSEPVKLNSKIADSCAVLAMEMETEDTLGVKFSKEVCPEERVFVRVEESWVHVERKPKLVVRC